MENILVCTDLQPRSRVVVEKSINLAKKTGGRVTLVHVLNNMIMHTATFPDPLGNLENMNVTTDLQILEEQQAVINQSLNDLRSGFDFPIETKIAYGSLDEAILETAEEINADMIVIGTHESSGLVRFLEGDVSGALIHETKIPILVVPTDRDAD